MTPDSRTFAPAESATGTASTAALPLNDRTFLSWLERRYSETENGTFAIAGLREAIRERGLIEKPWLLAFITQWTDAVMAGALERRQREPGETRGDALMRIMHLNNGQGKDRVEEARIEIRNYALFFLYKAFRTGGMKKKQARGRAVAELAKQGDKTAAQQVSDKNAINIIAQIEAPHAPPAK